MKAKYYKELYLIKWEDSHMPTRNRWDAIEKLEKMVCISVGYITKEKKGNITVIPHISGMNYNKKDRSVCGVITIPIAAIIKKTKLNLKRHEKEK